MFGPSTHPHGMPLHGCTPYPLLFQPNMGNLSVTMGQNGHKIRRKAFLGHVKRSTILLEITHSGPNHQPVAGADVPLASLLFLVANSRGQPSLTQNCLADVDMRLICRICRTCRILCMDVSPIWGNAPYMTKQGTPTRCEGKTGDILVQHFLYHHNGVVLVPHLMHRTQQAFNLDLEFIVGFGALSTGLHGGRDPIQCSSTKLIVTACVSITNFQRPVIDGTHTTNTM